MARIVLAAVFFAGLMPFAAAGAANAALYTTASQAAGRSVDDPSRFKAIIGYAGQCVTGIRCWVYTKGSRSSVATYPESWYLHVDGVRVMDRVFHLYVMDPRNPGWQQHIAQTCTHRCYLDGMGTSSLGRTVPHLAWSRAEWAAGAALVVQAVRAAGKRVMPNSVGAQSLVLVTAAGGRASTENFTVATAQTTLGWGHIWVTEIGNCLAKYHAFLQYRGRGDHFACYEAGMLPWDTGWLR